MSMIDTGLRCVVAVAWAADLWKQRRARVHDHSRGRDRQCRAGRILCRRENNTRNSDKCPAAVGRNVDTRRVCEEGGGLVVIML